MPKITHNKPYTAETTVSFKISDPEMVHLLQSQAATHGFKSQHLFARSLVMQALHQTDAQEAKQLLKTLVHQVNANSKEVQSILLQLAEYLMNDGSHGPLTTTERRYSPLTEPH